MAQKSGFFNAKLNAGVYDRKYSANDYSDNLAVVISTGVLRSTTDDLKVTASGLNLTVNTGRAWINGHYYYNDSPYAMSAITTPTGGKRIDRVVLRFDNTISVRSITLQYLQGAAGNSPVAPALTRTATIYDICLAEITVQANASTVSVKDTRSDASICGWVYSTSGDNSFFTSLDSAFNTWFDETKDTLASVTLFKRYSWATTLASAATVVTFSIPQYDADTCFIEVFVNGILSTAYTQSGNRLTFTSQLIAGTKVQVYAYKSIDGTGILSVADEITQLQNAVAALSGVSDFTYKCTGTDDNISLSQISDAIHTGTWNDASCTAAANAFLTALGGLTWLQSLEADAQITIDVVGTCGVTTPAYGSGTSASRYRYFNFGQTSHQDMRVMFDFSRCDTIYISCASNTSNIIFYGTDLWVKGARVYASNTGVSAANCDIQMVASSNAGSVNVENCLFYIKTTANGRISDAGTYINCDCTVLSSAGSAFCFSPVSTKLLRVIGGRFLAYVSNTASYTAAVFYTASAQSNAITIAQNINCPTISYSDGSSTNYYQQYLSVGYAGKTFIDYVVSTMNSTGTYNTITNQIWQSKAY